MAKKTKSNEDDQLADTAIKLVRIWVPDFGIKNRAFSRLPKKQRRIIERVAKDCGVSAITLTHSMNRMDKEKRRSVASTIVSVWMRKQYLEATPIDKLETAFEPESKAFSKASGVPQEEVRKLLYYTGYNLWLQRVGD